MRMAIALVPLALLAASAGATRKSKVIEPLPAELIGHITVSGTSVAVGETARANFDKLEAKAAAKNGAPAAAPAAAANPGTPPPAPDRYAGMPFATMFPLIVDEETKAWGLTGGRPVRLSVTIDGIKTANAGMAMLLASSDQLAGTVAVSDAATGEKLGEFYVDVLNTSGGMLGLALRGGGVREKLAHGFAQRIAIELSGSKHKPKAAS